MTVSNGFILQNKRFPRETKYDHYRNEAKPASVQDGEIWKKIDDNVPIYASELSYVATETSSFYATIFEGKFARRIVFYWLSWVNTVANLIHKTAR